MTTTTTEKRNWMTDFKFGRATHGTIWHNLDYLLQFDYAGDIVAEEDFHFEPTGTVGGRTNVNFNDNLTLEGRQAKFNETMKYWSGNY